MAAPSASELIAPPPGSAIDRTAGMVRFAWTAAMITPPEPTEPDAPTGLRIMVVQPEPDPVTPDAPTGLQITAVLATEPDAPTHLTIEEAA